LLGKFTFATIARFLAIRAFVFVVNGRRWRRTTATTYPFATTAGVGLLSAATVKGFYRRRDRSCSIREHLSHWRNLLSMNLSLLYDNKLPICYYDRAVPRAGISSSFDIYDGLTDISAQYNSRSFNTGCDLKIKFQKISPVICKQIFSG